MSDNIRSQISLVGDFSGTIPENVLLVEEDKDYAVAARQIRESLALGKETKIWVRKRAYYSWLQAYAESIEFKAEFKEKTPRLILAESWNVSIPDWLTDKEVLDQKLLNINLVEIRFNNFTDAILSELLGDYLAKSQISIEDLSLIMNIASAESQSLFERYPVLNRCFEDKCIEWSQQSNQPWVSKVCEQLKSEPETLWHDMSLWVLLHQYPKQLLEYQLPLHRIALVQQLLPGKLNDLELHVVAVEEASNQVEIFFNDIKNDPENGEDIDRIIKCCSGKLRVEFVKLLEIINKYSSFVQTSHLESIKTKFSSCPGISTSDIMKLNTYLIPTIPKILKKGEVWSSSEWCTWTKNEYVPYRRWLTESSKENSDLEETVAFFSDWYIENFSEIQQDSERSLVHILSSWDNRIRKDKVSLILIIDCLPLTYFDLLLKAMNINGFHKHEEGVRFAPLPTNTETCKSLLLTGDWDSNDKASYKSIVQQRVETSWPGKKGYYLADLQAMASIDFSDDEEEVVYVLNYLPSDEVMHSNPALKGMTYDDELFNCFTKLAETVHSFIQRRQFKSDDVSIYIVTDHGAARILDSELRSFESTVVNELFDNPKHRFATILKQESSTIPKNLWDIGYQFEQPFGDSETTYFIPQGHKTAGIKKRAPGFVHGGATPEEVIIPVAVFKAVKSEWKDPLSRFVDTKLDSATSAAIFHIQRLVEINVAIQNPNPENLRIVRAEIVKPESSEIREFHTSNIAANSEKLFNIKCYFKQAATKETELSMRFIYQYGEEERELLISINSTFKSAMTGGFSLKNL